MKVRKKERRKIGIILGERIRAENRQRSFIKAAGRGGIEL